MAPRRRRAPANPINQLLEQFTPELVARMTTAERLRLHQLQQRLAQITGLPPQAQPWPAEDPQDLIRLISPKTAWAPLAEHHRQFWDHVMGIQPSVRPTPMVFLVNRGGAKSASAEMAAVLLGGARRRRYCLYCSGSQDQADDHVDAVAAILEGPELERQWPGMADRHVGKFGNSKGWRRNRLRTASGFTIDAIGLVDSARGARMEEQRPDLLIFDDVDALSDSPLVVQKKLRAITKSIIPAGSPDAAILFVQNLIHANSVAARLANPEQFPEGERLLANRVLIGPIPAVHDLEIESYQLTDGRTNYRIRGGRASWSGLPLARCEALINDQTLPAFLAEYQHDTTPAAGGLFSHITCRTVDRDMIPWSRIVETVVWVDPAVTANDGSDAAGITCAAVDSEGLIWVLAWQEKVMTVTDAMRTAILCAVDHGASIVGVETNQGGDTWRVVYQRAWDQLVKEGRVPRDRRPPKYAEAKAGSNMSKAGRAALMVHDLEHGHVILAAGPDNLPLAAALHRFPLTPPLDGVDSLAWAWKRLRKVRPSPKIDGTATARLEQTSGWQAPDSPSTQTVTNPQSGWVSLDGALAGSGWRSL